MKVTVRELKRSLTESASEFDAKYGNGLSHGKLNSTFQMKADADARKNANPVSADKGERYGNQKGSKLLSNDDFYENSRNDYERLQKSIPNFLDINGMDDEYVERYKAGLEGYITPQDKKTREAEMDKNGVINGSNAQYHSKKWADHQQDAYDKNTQRKEYAKNTSMKRHNERCNNKKSNEEIAEGKLPTLTFKHTRFLTEGHAVALIPESLKVDGKQFIMRDMNRDTYLFEWAGGAKCLRHECKQKLDEHLNRTKQLFGFKDEYNDTNTNSNRVNEEAAFKNMMDIVRGIKK